MQRFIIQHEKERKLILFSIPPRFLQKNLLCDMSWDIRRKRTPLGKTSYYHQKVHDISDFDNTEYFVQDLRHTLKSSLSSRLVSASPSKSVTFEDEKRSSLPYHRLPVQSDSLVKLSDLLDGLDNIPTNKSKNISNWTPEKRDLRIQQHGGFKHSIYNEVLGDTDVCYNIPSVCQSTSPQKYISWDFSSNNNADIIERPKTFGGPFYVRESSWVPSAKDACDDLMGKRNARDETNMEGLTLLTPRKQGENSNTELPAGIMRSQTCQPRIRNCLSRDSTSNRQRCSTSEINIKFSMKR